MVQRADEDAGILRGGAWSSGFSELPATAVEVDGIARELRELHPDAAVTLLEGGDATRERLLELAPRARWLHVATHGWFAPESIRSWKDPEPIDRLTGLGLRASGEEQVKGMSPMLLCGLALAGANLPEDELGRVPGLITAEELSTLDLSGCELAVLSACDTNVGERRAGQGVASLQMALQMAGARSVITSLWKVPDEATRELMTDFYRRIWVEKKPKGQALWEAKMRLRDARDESGRPRYSLRDWAAWVLTGEPE
jgi:CHAT domain-containing protein